MAQLPRTTVVHSAVFAVIAGLAIATSPSLAVAQQAPSPPPPATPPPEAPSPPAAVSLTPEPPAAAVADTGTVAPVMPWSTPPAPPPPPDPKVVSVGAWIRLGGRVQNPTAPTPANPGSMNRLDDFYLDTLYMIATFNGRVNDWLRWQINLNALVPTPSPVGMPPPAYASVGVQDLVVKIEPDPLFNVWIGRMLVPVDRDNLSGPWFINYWTFTGFLGGYGGAPPAPFGAKTGPNGRDDGVNVWGQIGGGRAKYYLGAYNLDSRVAATGPLWTARVNVDLLDPEPGYYHQSAYHGDKDILAIGGGLQFQKNGVTNAAMGLGDLTIGEVDLLVDKRLGSAGVATFEVEAYFFDQREAARKFFNIDLGYVLPQPFGPGRLAPAVRYQFTREPNFKQIDGYLQYLIKSHFAKFFLGFIYADLNGTKSQAIQAGIQLIKM